MIIEFRRKVPAVGSHARTQGVYAIILNGREIGLIRAGSQRIMLPGDWEIVERGAWNIGRHDFNTLKEAKTYVVRNLKKRYLGAV